MRKSIYNLSGITQNLLGEINGATDAMLKLDWIDEREAEHVLEHVRNPKACAGDPRYNKICPVCIHKITARRSGAIVNNIRKMYPIDKYPFRFHVTYRMPRYSADGHSYERRLLGSEEIAHYKKTINEIINYLSPVIVYHALGSELSIHSHFHSILCLAQDPYNLEAELTKQWNDRVFKETGAIQTDYRAVKVIPIKEQSLYLSIYYMYRPLLKTWNIVDADDDYVYIKLYSTTTDFKISTISRKYMCFLFGNHWRLVR